MVRVLADTLAGSLQRVLREDLGGTYGVSVTPDMTKRPDEEYRLAINFACDPARMQDLIKAMFAVVDQFRTDGPSAGQVADVQAALRRDLEVNLHENGWTMNQLAYAYQYNEPLPDAATLRGLYDQLSTTTLRDAAKQYLDTNRYVKVVLVPEGR
jgi:zinc protease